MTETAVPLAGVVGWPIAHSRSPILHGHWLKRYGINGHYVPLGIKPQDFETAIRNLPKLGFRGVNLTLPYKEAILPMADSVTDRASLIGAANTITFREDGSIMADNTDGYGFLENIRAAQPNWVPSAGPALILGSGGAARGVCSALLAAGVPKLKISNRTRQRAEILKEHLGARVEIVDWNSTSQAARDVNLIVNTTVLGMTGKPDLAFSFEHATASSLVCDIVYTPLQTEFLRKAADRGHPTIDGLGMLLHQAVPGFETWFGKRPEVDQELRLAVLAE